MAQFLTRFSSTLAIWLVSFAAVLAATALPSGEVMAADDPTPAPGASSNPLSGAREHIAAKRWQAALRELKRVDARNDADWNNLMGYALRKQASPDLAAAETFYGEALRIKPDHLGALEYIGELHLMKGDLDKAEQRLATLSRACKDCEELRDLKEAIARYKAAGNRFVAN